MQSYQTLRHPTLDRPRRPARPPTRDRALTFGASSTRDSENDLAPSPALIPTPSPQPPDDSAPRERPAVAPRKPPPPARPAVSPRPTHRTPPVPAAEPSVAPVVGAWDERPPVVSAARNLAEEAMRLRLAKLQRLEASSADSSSVPVIVAPPMYANPPADEDALNPFLHPPPATPRGRQPFEDTIADMDLFDVTNPIEAVLPGSVLD